MRVPDGLRMTEPEEGRQLEDAWKREGLGGPSRLFLRAKLLYNLVGAAAMGAVALFFASGDWSRALGGSSMAPWTHVLLVSLLLLGAVAFTIRGWLDWRKASAPRPPPP